jgi:nonsense-mediated mRNA decay protein 3
MNDEARLLRNFCPKCGKETEKSGLCNACRVRATEWFTCDQRVTSTICPSCGSTKVVNTWTDTNRERSEMAPELARSAVHFHQDVKHPEVNSWITDLSPNKSKADLEIRGTLYKTQVEGKCSVEIRWIREQCDRCNRIRGSYHEGVIQVRAESRIPGIYEIQMSQSIAQQVEDSLQAGGERLSFISDFNETRDGLDITIGSQHIGMLISQAIVAQLGGRYTTHPKLVGEKNGRQLFRITYSVRLPRFQKHDVIAAGRKYYEVDRVESRYIRATDLSDGSSKSIRDDESVRIIGNSRNALSALVVFSEGGIVGIMDPGSCKTLEIRNPAWIDAQPGQHLRFLRDGEIIVLVG